MTTYPGGKGGCGGTRQKLFQDSKDGLGFLFLTIYLRFQYSWDYSRPYIIHRLSLAVTSFGEYGLMLVCGPFTLSLHCYCSVHVESHVSYCFLSYKICIS